MEAGLFNGLTLGDNLCVEVVVLNIIGVFARLMVAVTNACAGTLSITMH